MSAGCGLLLGVDDFIEQRSLPWSYYHYKNMRGNAQAQGIYWVLPDSAFSVMLSTLASGATWSEIGEQQRQDALDSLRTSSCGSNATLIELLTSELGGDGS